jgi:hypothetical protein
VEELEVGGVALLENKMGFWRGPPLSKWFTSLIIAMVSFILWIILYIVVAFTLSGCGGIPPAVSMGLSAAGGVVAITKDILDLDVAWHQQTPEKPRKLIRWNQPPL